MVNKNATTYVSNIFYAEYKLNDTNISMKHNNIVFHWH